MKSESSEIPGKTLSFSLAMPVEDPVVQHSVQPNPTEPSESVNIISTGFFNDCIDPAESSINSSAILGEIQPKSPAYPDDIDLNISVDSHLDLSLIHI